MLLLSRSEVEELLDVDELINALGAAMADLSAGLASTPPRVAAIVPEHAAMLAVMPGVPALGACVDDQARVVVPGEPGPADAPGRHLLL